MYVSMGKDIFVLQRDIASQCWITSRYHTFIYLFIFYDSMFAHDTRTPEWTSYGPQLTQMHGQTITMRSQTICKESEEVFCTCTTHRLDLGLEFWDTGIVLRSKQHHGWSKGGQACPFGNLTLTEIVMELQLIFSQQDLTFTFSSPVCFFYHTSLALTFLLLLYGGCLWVISCLVNSSNL